MSVLTGYDKFIQQALKYGFSLWGTAKTGQTTSYRTGDDGHYEKGYPKTPPRFVDNGDGTITDNATGLMWAKDGEGLGCNNKNKIAWANAIDWAVGLTFAGHSDWRLPNIKELMSITDFSEGNPPINPTFFPNTAVSGYFSSTTSSSFTTWAWYILYHQGGAIALTLKTDDTYVRAVRGV